MNSKPERRLARFARTLGLHRKDLRAWALYDWGNSAFACTILVAVTPLYYADVAAATLEPNLRTAYWGYTSSIALIIIALLGPLLGAVADRFRAKKKLLGFFAAMGISGSAALYFVGHGDWLFASIAFIIGNVGFFAGNVFYESLLPSLASEEDIHRVSTAGYAVGYFGGGVLLAVNLWWIMQPDLFGFADKGSAVRWSFVSVAAWWAFFSVPLFRHVPEPEGVGVPATFTGVGAAMRTSFHELKRTFAQLRLYRQAFLFLLAFWAFSDGIGTIMKMATIYGREVGIGSSDLIGAILMVQFVGVPAAFLVGAIASRVGAKKTLMGTLIVYFVITGIAYFMESAADFWMLAVGIALVQGGAQALSRSLYATMIPRDRAAEFFGFYSFSSKLSGVVGPLFFGLIAQFGGDSRSGVLVVLALFAIGMVLLTKVDVTEGAREAKAG